MFNLSTVPTDSLYKFSFVFGLLLIVYSFYYSDQHLDHFNKQQNYYQIDSLTGLLTKTDSLSAYVTGDSTLDFGSMDMVNEIQEFQDLRVRILSKKRNGHDTIRVYYKNSIEKLSEDLYYTYSRLNINNLHKIEHLIKLANFEFTYDDSLRREITVCGMISAELLRNNTKIFRKTLLLEKEIDQKQRYFYILLGLGTLLFFLGTIFWYLKIQKPQDKLLKIQVEKSRGPDD